MGRGRGNQTAAQSAATHRRSTFSPRWDEIRRNIKPGATPTSSADPSLTDLLRKVRFELGPRRPGTYQEVSEQMVGLLVKNLRAEHPDGERRPPCGEGYEAPFWDDVTSCVRVRLANELPRILVDESDYENDSTPFQRDVVWLQDMSRVMYMTRCLRSAPDIMECSNVDELTRLLTEQLPRSVWKTPVRCVELGYADLGEAFNKVSHRDWVDIYAKLTDDKGLGGRNPPQAWMRPHPNVPFMDRYREKFASGLMVALHDGTVPPRGSF